MFCTQCGSPLGERDRFCAHCGAPVPAAPAYPAAEIPPDTPQPAPVPPDLTPEPVPAPEPPRMEPAARPIPESAAASQSSQPDPQPAHPKPRKLSALSVALGAAVVAVVCLALVLTGVFTVGGSGRMEGPGFDSPEAAAKAYLEALKAGDVEGMLSAFAMETYVEKLDLETFVDLVGVYYINMALPGDSDLIHTYNLEKRRADLTQMFIYQYLTLLTQDTELLEGVPMRVEEGEAKAMLRDLTASNDLETLSGLEIGKFQRPELVSEYYMEGKNQQNLARQAEIRGADEVRPVAVEVRVDGQDYLFCPDAVCYDGTWYLLSPVGNLAILLGASTYAGGFVLEW